MQLELPRRALARAYGISPAALASWEQKGAPVHDVDLFAEWLRNNSERFGLLVQLLLDGETRRRLREEIRRLGGETKFKI